MKNAKVTGLFLALGMMGAAATVNAQENYAQWTGHQTLWLNTQSNGAAVDVPQVNFPVLVRLTAAQATVFTAAKAGGADIRFSKANDVTPLKYQIERWDAGGQAAEIWVLVDTVKARNGSQTIRMHWGKADAVDSSNGAAVFQTTDGFQAVYHFNQDAANPMLDATANALTATPTSVTNATGMIGPAKAFDGATSRYDIVGSAGGPLSFPAQGNYSVSAWVNETDMPNAIRAIVAKGDAHWTLQRHWNAARTHNYEFFERSAGWNAVISPATPGVWKHVVGVRNLDAMAIYVDGALMSTEILISSTGAINAGVDVAIGVRGDNSTRWWNGMIDEVNISSVSRTADWVKLSYENQKAAQTLVAFTQPVSVDAGKAQGRSARLQAKPLGAGLVFSLPQTSARSRLTVSDMFGRTVWSKTVDVNTASLSWDGSSLTGGTVARGTYLIRLAPVNGAKNSAVWEAKVALTR